MTGLILVDESGDLGSAGSSYFTMTAVITSRSRNLLSVSKLIPITMPEHKFYNATEDERISVAGEYALSDSTAVSAAVEKNHPLSGDYLYGNDLYRIMLRRVIDLAVPLSTTKDINIIVDNSRYITNSELREICESVTEKNQCNLKKCYKGISQNEPCLRVVDYIESSVGAEYERGNRTYTNLFREKISVARKY
jgi:hypothetical protein